MRLIMAIVLILLLIGLAESVRVGGTAEKILPLGSLAQNASFQENITEDTNATNQTNSTAQDSGIIEIKSPMSIIPLSHRQGTTMPNSIQANSIAYQFTT